MVELTNEGARVLRITFVDKYIRDVLPTFPNRIRAVNDCVNQLTTHLLNEGFNKEMCPLPATIGDIDPWELGFSFSREPDPFEKEYHDLADRLTLDPEGPNFTKLQENEKNILINYKKNGIAMTRYNPDGGKGTKEVRKIVTKEMNQLGLEISPNDVWMGYGGGDVIERTARSVNTHFLNNYGRRATMLTPTVGFSMVVGAIADDFVEVRYLDSSDLPRNELTANRLEKYMEEIEIPPDIVLLTPANNPNAQCYDPETFRGFLNKMKEFNENAVYIFDMAYMWTIPRDLATELMNVIKETGVDKRAMFANSLSKKTARPGTRLGSLVIPNPELGKIFHRDNMRHIATWSGDLDVLYQALDQTVDETAYSDLNKMFRQRQKAILDVLTELNQDNKYFKNLKLINIEGYENPQGTINQVVPLYLFVEFQDGITAFDVLKDLNIGANPSDVFGPEDGYGTDKTHLRLSVGFASTTDILKMAPSVLEKWNKKFATIKT